jgi:hypothetical protein
MTDKARRSTRGASASWLPFVIPLVGALIGAAASLGGSYLATTAQADQQQAAKLLAQRQSDYSAFLEDSNSYAQAALAIDAFQLDGHALNDDGGAALVNQFRSARHDFRAEINNVYVYGSRPAWRAANKLVATLPDTTGQETNFVFDTTVYNDAYRQFLRVFCIEAQSGPECSNR